MTTIVTRAGKGSALTNAEMDANFNNLNNNKLEVGSGTTAQVIHNPLSYTSSRTSQDKHSELMSIKDFGAVGDGATDNTTAFTNACTWMEVNKRPIFIPPGIYLTGNFTLDLNTDLSYGGFVGVDPRTTIIQSVSATSGALFTISSSSGTTYQGQLHFENITFKASGTAAGSACVKSYDLAWSTFDNCAFQYGETAFDCYGGVNITFKDCMFQNAKYGLRIGKYTRATGGWPNNIKVRGGVASDNTLWGVYFNDGRQLIIDGMQIEGNGTTLGQVQGGLYVGSGIGDETGVAASNPSQGVIVESTWFEANKGVADIYCLDGYNIVNDSLFYSMNTQVTNNVYIGGGKYLFKGCDAHWTNFTYNFYELSSSAVFSGNMILNSDFSTTLWNNTKTSIIGGTTSYLPNLTVASATSVGSTLNVSSTLTAAASIVLSNSSSNVIVRNEQVPTATVAGSSPAKPAVITGFSNSGSSADVTVSIGRTMASAAAYTITIQPLDSGGNIATPEIIATTDSSFTVRKRGLVSGSATATTINYSFYWTVIGGAA